MVEEERRLVGISMHNFRRAALGAVVVGAEGAFLAAIIAPIVLACLALIWMPPFLTDETYWQASALGACVGALVGIVRGWIIGRQRVLSRMVSKIAGSLVGLALVLLLGVP